MTCSPEETPGREDYYNAALIGIILFCGSCRASLDPDVDLGEGIRFESDGYYVLLGDEASRRGSQISFDQSADDYLILCPDCAAKRG